MKLPNGFGTVYKLSGKRRKPYIARKTIGWTEEGKQTLSTIGYYTTRQEGLQALAAFNDNPYDLVMSKTTFAEIYQRWSAENFNDETNRSTKKNYEAAYKQCTALYEMKMADIRPHHMQQVLDQCPNGYQSVKRIKILFNQLYKWCMKHDCIKKNYSDSLTVNIKDDPTPRRAISKEHVQLLWDNVGKNPYVALVLIFIYCGVRANELLNLKKEHVHLEEQWFSVHASKTQAGIRTVPIADKVLPFWKAFMEQSTCEYAICTVEGKRLTYENFKKRYWKPLMAELHFDYTAHETRHTCISLMTMKNVNPTIIKKIVGHKSIMNLTERVYTHIEIEELLNAINAI